ncbi:MAG TPA: DUF2817 domain-containing protein, partial [Candidatus Sulfotelmatobacter sp.]|nr:DUF2817 domain-containing protein [Candidatus Sulfotelmatobacter sp.]
MTQSAQVVRRLGKNLTGYFGETIEIKAVLKQCVAAARAHGWTVETVPAGSKPSLLALTRTGAGPTRQRASGKGEPSLSPQLAAGASTARPRIYVSTGIHGDEPAGPLAALHLLQENQWPADLDLWLWPCLNPTGFLLNRRENDEGLDLNRQYLHPASSETVAHMGRLEQQPGFEVCLCLHE